ncbi:hypothetical protein JVU11DRAFT_7753 [Chiua virens]|nr:hypothetical protein JVU11DRAFT_7753 [Chiua virens]
MFISQSSLSLNPTLSASETTSGDIPLARTNRFPVWLPLSTLLAPPLDQPSTAPSHYTPSSRSSLLSEFSTMPPSGAIRRPNYSWLVGDVSPPILPSSSALSTVKGLSTDIGLSTVPMTSTPTSAVPFPAPTSSLWSASTTDFMNSPSPSFSASTPSSTFATNESPSTSLNATTVVFSTTVTTSISTLSSSRLTSLSTSTYTITYVLSVQGGTTTEFFTSNAVLSTQSPGNTIVGTTPPSPGTITAIVLGIVGTLAFAVLWLFCARRRHRNLVREAALVRSGSHASRPLEDEIPDVDELGYGIGSVHSTVHSLSRTGPVVEERYAGLLATLHSTEGFGRGHEGGSTGGIYGSHRDTHSDMDGDDITQASSPTLPIHAILPDESPYVVPLSPPPTIPPPSYHQTTQPAPPPSSYYMTSRRKSSPGPDAAAWLSGHSVAPSCSSHYARSQTLGSGSGSGSVDALTRTRTGSEEPLLNIGKPTSEMSAGVSSPTPTTLTDPGSNRPGFGSAFGSPAASLYSPSSIYPALQYDPSGFYNARTASGSGSYGYARSGTPNSFNVLRSVSSQGALSSMDSAGHSQSQGYRFGFGRPGSASSASTGKKAGSFGAPPTSFRAWKDRGSIASDKEKQGEKQNLREKDWIHRTKSLTSASTAGSADEKQGRSSPIGVRALLGRLRRAGHTPSPHSSHKDLPSPTQPSTDGDPEKATADRNTTPPIQIQAATPRRQRFSFILSNPDPQPPSPESRTRELVTPLHVPRVPELHMTQHDVPSCDPHSIQPVPFSPEGQPATPPPAGFMLAAPSPVPTEESRLVEGLLHPRLRNQGRSDASLRDFEDYSRPIGGIVKNRLYSTTTFGTQDDAETATQSQGTLDHEVTLGDEYERESELVDVFGNASTLRGIPRDSWFFDDFPKPAREIIDIHHDHET